MASPALFAIGLCAVVFFMGSEAQEFQFSSFSQIPQSLLDSLPKEQVESLRQSLKKTGGGSAGGTSGGSGQGGKGGDITTYQIGNAMPGQAEQTFQFSSFSQIPQSLLAQMPPEQVESLRQTLKKPTPQVRTLPPSPQQPADTKTYQFTSYDQIPPSILSQLTDSQKESVMKILSSGGTFTFGGTGKPGTTITHTKGTTQYFNIPGGNNKKVNDLLNVAVNFMSNGGNLSGIPAVDLLLLRFYLNMGPQKFCPS